MLLFRGKDNIERKLTSDTFIDNSKFHDVILMHKIVRLGSVWVIKTTRNGFPYIRHEILSRILQTNEEDK